MGLAEAERFGRQPRQAGELSEGDERLVDEGHYVDEGAASIAWPESDTIVWLDLPRRVAVRRAVVRSVLVRRWPSYPSRIECALAEDDQRNRSVVRLRTRAQVAEWIQLVE